MGDSDNEGNFFDPEEDIGYDNENKINLPDMVLKSGEENEDCVFSMRAKLFRWRKDEWKERGVGGIKLLRSKEKGEEKIRLILRQDKTLKVVANFFVSNVSPLCELEPHQGSDKMFFFTAFDCSDEEALIEKLVIKLGNAENAKLFKESFNAAKLFNKCVESKKMDEAVWAKVVVDDKDNVKSEDKKDEKKEEKKEDVKEVKKDEEGNDKN